MNKTKLLLLGVAVALCACLTPVHGQVKNLLSVYNSTSDTVTNTGVVVLSVKAASGTAPVTVIVSVTENSGTTGGTLAMVGSMTGAAGTWRALTTKETATALATFTPSDVTTEQLFMWRLTECPTPYIGVQYTGTGTMAARYSAKMYTIK